MLEQVLDMLYGLYLFDIMIFSNIWLYIPLMIPFFFYLMFFMMKWAILIAPIWLPIKILLDSIFKEKKQYFVPPDNLEVNIKEFKQYLKNKKKGE